MKFAGASKLVDVVDVETCYTACSVPGHLYTQKRRQFQSISNKHVLVALKIFKI